MRGYQIKVQGKVKKWGGSMADCRAAKAELVEKGVAEKASHVTYEEVEVPTDKAGLIVFLNANCVE